MTTDVQRIDFAEEYRYALDNVMPGQSLSWTIQFYEEDDETEIDITGDTFDCEIRDAAGNLFLALAIGDGIAITDTNEITLSLEEADTANFNHELTYNYQVNWTNGGNVLPVGYGPIELLKPVITT